MGKSPFEIIYDHPISHYLDPSSVPYQEHRNADTETIIEHIQNVQWEVIEKL